MRQRVVLGGCSGLAGFKKCGGLVWKGGKGKDREVHDE